MSDKSRTNPTPFDIFGPVMGGDAWRQGATASTKLAQGAVKASAAGWKAYMDSVTGAATGTPVPTRMAMGALAGYAQFFACLAETSMQSLSELQDAGDAATKRPVADKNSA